MKAKVSNKLEDKYARVVKFNKDTVDVRFSLNELRILWFSLKQTVDQYRGQINVFTIEAGVEDKICEMIKKNEDLLSSIEYLINDLERKISIEK